MVFDVATGVVLACTAAAWWAIPPAELPARYRCPAFAAAALGVVLLRLFTDPTTALQGAATLLLLWAGYAIGREVVVNRRWPAGLMVAVVAVVTATGVYLRAERLDDVLSVPERRLQPDVRYYQEQALRTANPFAAGQKSPLWPALHAPLVRLAEDTDAAMRVWSWSFGVLMVPAVGLVLGRLLHPVAGVVVAAMLAVDTWLVDLCCEGLREEAGVCLWMLIFTLLFGGERPGWRRVAGASLAGGVLLLLRNIDIVPLVLVTAFAGWQGRWRPLQVATALLVPVLIVLPFYMNQHRAYGDAFAMEKRDARYHANLEFGGRTPPAGLSMPTREEFDRDLFAGEPLSPLAYLVRYHDAGTVVANQWKGISSVVLGVPFQTQTSLWLRLICAGGLVAALASRRHRFATVFVLASLIGMRAHLQAIGQLEQRLLLPVMVVWLGAGMWLLVNVIEVGLRVWTNRSATGSGPASVAAAPRGGRS